MAEEQPMTRAFSILVGLLSACLIGFGMGGGKDEGKPSFPEVMELRPQLRSLAKDIANKLKTENQTQVAMDRAFVGPPTLGSQFGQWLSRALEAELKSLGINVVARGGKYGLAGSFQPHESHHTVGIEITVAILDARGGKLAEFMQLATSPEIYVRAFGGTGDLTVSEGTAGRVQSAIEAVASPKFVATGANGSVIRTSEKSKVGVEVMVGPSSDKTDTRKPESRDGSPFVLVNPGDVYVVKVWNDNDFDIGVHLEIDGISMFHFAEGDAKKYYWMVIPKGSYTIKGWYLNQAGANEFKVAEYYQGGQGSVVKDPGKVGTITIAYCNCWNVDKNPPEDEHGVAGSPVQTSQGSEIKVETKVVERIFGKTRGVISIWYDRKQ
jgi:hypothetical protein